MTEGLPKKPIEAQSVNKRTFCSAVFWWSIGFSLGLHLILVVFFPHFFTGDLPKRSVMQTEVIFKEKVAQPDKKLVELPLEENNQRPKDANFIANEDHKAKKEMTARPQQPQLIKIASSSATTQEKSEKQELAINPPSVDDFFRATKKSPPPKNDPLGLKDFKQLALATANQDFVKDVEEGDKTDLNAWQWRHAPFFNRVKSAVGSVWAPNVQISRFDPQGQLLGQKDRTTVMSVTIDAEGKLRNLKVAQTSGVAYLDEEAERSFKAAAPFPFPPKELFDDNQEFTFKFAFHLAINRGLSFDFEWDSPN